MFVLLQYPDYLQIPHSPSQPPQLPPARRPVHVPVGDQKLKQVLEIDKTFCETSVNLLHMQQRFSYEIQFLFIIR